jgi:O-antigen ligase
MRHADMTGGQRLPGRRGSSTGAHSRLFVLQRHARPRSTATRVVQAKRGSQVPFNKTIDRLNRMTDRPSLLQWADGLAIAVVVSLPWSTSGTSILTVLWLLVTVPTLNFGTLRDELRLPSASLPVLLAALGVLGMLWSPASWAERIDGVHSFLRLLLIPLLFAQFRRSSWGHWALIGFLASSALLLLLSWAYILQGPLDPSAIWKAKDFGIPVKDRTSQSGAFTICAFVALDLACSSRMRLPWRLGLLALAAIFLANIFYVATSRTTLIVIPVLVLLFGFFRLGWKRALGWFLACGLLAAVVWASSPYLQFRASRMLAEVHEYHDATAESSIGDRLSFWAMSLHAIDEAPLIGHGTGSIREVFRRQGSQTASNTHNQIFAVALQLGFVGFVVLIAMWAAHWQLFCRAGTVAWVGLVVVTQNFVSSLFNSHLFDFTQAMIYVFGVGIAGGMLRAPSSSRQFNEQTVMVAERCAKYSEPVSP